MGVKKFNPVTSFAKVNMMDPKQVGYQDSIDIIHEELHKTRKSFVKIGWYLKHINEEKMYAEDGYSNIYDFAHDKFNISQPTATRFINLCNEFSVGHDSPELDERYLDFSVSQLFEMLPMKPEEREQITSDMPVQEIREVKKENKSLNEPKDAEIELFYNYELKHISANNRKNLKSYLLENYRNRGGGDNTFYFRCTPRGITINDSDEITWTRFVNRVNELIPMEDTEPEAVENTDDNIPGQTSIEKDFPEYMPDSGVAKESLSEEIYATSHKNEVDEQKIIDGKYREIEKSQGASAYGLPKTEYPKGSLLTTEGCGHKYDCFICAQDCGIRQKERYCCEAPCGNPFACTTMNVLENLKNDIGNECQFINLDLAEHKASGEPDPCCKNCQINDCGYRCRRAVKVLPELNDTEEECVISPEQSDFPIFKNNEQRKAWLEDVEAWGLWYEDSNIQAKYYKYDFPDGSRLIAVKYRYTCPPWMKNNSNFKENAEFDGSYRDAHYHMIYSEQYKKKHKNEYENYYTHSTVSITALIDFIKEIAKQGRE